MKAIILAGGKGERLKPLTDTVPKPMIEINGKTLLEWQFDLLKKYGITEITLAIGYLADTIKEFYGNGEKFGVKLQYVVEECPLGTAGCLRFLKNDMEDTFVMMNGDELKEIELNQMLQQHSKTKAVATISLVQVEDVSKFGIVEIDKENKIHRFVEKPSPDQAPSNLASAGFYILEPSVIDMVPEGFSMVEKIIFPKLAEEGKLYGHKIVGKWYPTDTFERIDVAKQGWQK